MSSRLIELSLETIASYSAFLSFSFSIISLASEVIGDPSFFLCVMSKS
ncbi:hypothetical protein F383_35937 [Gossypium arboreum]|uniref:Uncharacterized protein n=1 Tax=Gossypium arboreum TaxID=29729 RepID=A0A0B0N839_GOSAR|nr:hypothetical protein F383_35937 [Gossypium arboreum]